MSHYPIKSVTSTIDEHSSSLQCSPHVKREPLALPESPGEPLHVGLEQEGVGVDAADGEVWDLGPHGRELGVVAEIAFVSSARNLMRRGRERRLRESLSEVGTNERLNVGR